MIWELTAVKVMGADGAEVDTKKFYLFGLRDTATNVTRSWKKFAFSISRY